MARWQVKFQTFSRVRRKFFFGKSFFPAYVRGFAKNAILSCHLAIFVSLFPFLKGVGWQVKIQNLAYAGGQAGTFGVWFFPPARLRARVCKNAILSCHLAIFVSLFPFLKGVGCRMASEKSKSHIRGRAGRNVRRRVFPPAYARGICKNAILSYTLHPLFGI